MKILSRFPASEVLQLYPGCCIWRNPGHVDCTCKDQLYTTCNTGLPENITFIARVTMTWRTCWQSVGETHHTCTRPCTVRHVHKISDLQHYTEYTHIAYPGKKTKQNQTGFPVQWIHRNSRVYGTDPLLMKCITVSLRCSISYTSAVSIGLTIPILYQITHVFCHRKS